MNFPHLELAADPHDRVGEHRADEAWLDEAWAAPETRVLVVAGSRVRPVDGSVPWIASEEIPESAGAGTRVLLGERDGRVWFAHVVDSSYAEGEGWVGIRDLLPHLAGAGVEQAPLVFHAIGLAEWLFATRFCPRCGGPLEPRLAGHELECAECHRRQFPRTDPAVIMAITHGEPGSPDEELLLGRQDVWATGRYSTLAGFLEPGETLEDAVRREVAEETGIVVGEVTYFGNQPWPLPSSLMLGFRGRAESRDIHVDGVEMQDARWFTRAAMREETAAGTLVLPGGVSISRSLVEDWYGGPLPGSW
ncbi:MAG TPA: NAD(+) diphosphatase [Nocardioides sp.]|uniref:NAD(+) diphosphatase n=1 Tax=Nocardioides sp. TaxID=35761 RepID=UPI002F424A64